MTKYNLGVIGAGMYGKVLMRWFRQDERATISWVNSASEATTKAAAEEFGVEKWTLDYREILADPAVDAVVIATPPYLHAEQLEASLDAGKQVLLEKPMAESLQNVRKMRSEEHTSELQSRLHLVCRLLLEKKKKLTTRDAAR